MKLSSQAFIIAFFRTFISMSGILAAMILSRKLSTADYGTYKQVWLIYNTFAPLLVLGVNTCIPYFIKEWEKTNERQLLVLSGLITSFNSICFGLCIYFGAELIGGYFSNPYLVPLLKIFAIYPFLELSISARETFFISKQKPVAASVTSLTASILLLSSSVIPIYLGKGIESAFSWIISAATIQYLFYFLLVIFYRPKTPLLPNIPQLKEYSSLAVTSGLAFVVLMSFSMIDKYFISYYYSAEKYALYANGSSQIPLVGIVVNSVMAVLFPRLVELRKSGDTRTMLNLWHEAIRKVSLFMYPVFAFCFVMAEEVMTILFSEAYIDSAIIFRIYLVMLLSRNANYSSLLLIFKDLKIYLILSSVSVLLNIVLNFTFIEAFGLEGPAYSTVITQLLLAGAFVYRGSRLMKVPFVNMLPKGTLMKILGIACVSALATYFLKVQYTESLNKFYRILACAAAYSVAFLLLAVWTRTLGLSDFKFLKFYEK